MKFDLDYYRSSLCLCAAIFLVCGILLFKGCISGILTIKKHTENTNKIKSITHGIGIVLALGLSIFFIISSIGGLRYGIYLITEKESDALVLHGEIEEIKELRNQLVHNYKNANKYTTEHYNIDELNAHLITISGKKYYCMVKGKLKVGDAVEITYLPKSTIVLEVNIVENK